MSKKKVKKKVVNKNKFDKYFLLNWKKLGIVVGAWILSVLLHNFVYVIFKSFFDANGGDEAFFFIIAIIVIPLYFLVMIVYSLIRLIVRGTGKSV